MKYLKPEITAANRIWHYKTLKVFRLYYHTYFIIKSQQSSRIELRGFSMRTYTFPLIAANIRGVFNESSVSSTQSRDSSHNN